MKKNINYSCGFEVVGVRLLCRGLSECFALALTPNNNLVD